MANQDKSSLTNASRKPFKNDTDLSQKYGLIFPKQRNQFKMIVLEFDGKLVFSLNLFVETNIKSGKSTGYIHDLLTNWLHFSKLDEPEEIIKRLMLTIEGIAWVNGCN